MECFDSPYYFSVRPRFTVTFFMLLIFSSIQILSAQNTLHEPKDQSLILEFRGNEYNDELTIPKMSQKQKKLYYEGILDSLKEFADLKNIANIYIRIANDADYELSYNTKDSLLHEALKINVALKFPEDIIKAYNQLFLLSFKTGNNKKALLYANQGLKIALEQNYNKSAAIIYSNISLIYMKMGDYEKANEYNYRALRVFQELNDTLHIARSKLNIGLVNIALKDYDKALLNITQARDEFRGIDDQRGYSISLTNIGMIHLNLENHELALRIFFEAVQIDEHNNDYYGVASNYNNIGEVYYNLGNLEKALQFLNQAHEIYHKLDDKSGLASVYLKLARVFTRKNELSKALAYCSKSISLLEETDEPVSKKKALEQLSLIHQKRGNYQLALKIFREASTLKDSLFNIDKAARVSMIEEKYVNEKLANENLKLLYTGELQQVKLKSQKSLNRVYLIALIVLILGMVVIIVQLRKKNLAYKFITKKNLDLIKKEQELKNAKEKMTSIIEINRNKPRLAPDEKEAILQRMEKLLEKDQLFTRPDLTIEKLAHRLGTNRTYLSQIINEVFYKSYSNFINEYRVDYAMKMLSDPIIGSKYSIDAIAKDSGFNSISNFNMVFKKFSGVTPSIFIKNIGFQSLTT
ncbi:MAG: tetratricopeptide repeat protein [Bacteroidales bacterium]|nr:tetratricopeptide repeat protein [Bacteroidales bacterium]